MRSPSDMAQVGVMHLVDTLAMGGKERVVVNLANLLTEPPHRAYLCTTRSEGPLADLVEPHVGRLSLSRTRTVQPRAVYRLVKYIQQEGIQIVHAHASALVLANLASMFHPFPAIVWHDHFGTNTIVERPAWLYRLLTRRVSAVLASSRELMRWSRDRLRVPADRCHYIPNFVRDQSSGPIAVDLPGTVGSRIVCVGNLRPVKDQVALVRAMASVVTQHPQAHLLLVGQTLDTSYERSIRGEIEAADLADHVSLLGARLDVPDVLRACDIGALSSRAETSPLAVLEYGMAQLPVVATDVGDCRVLLDDGRAGIVVDAGRPHMMAEALHRLLSSAELRSELSRSLYRHVSTQYSQSNITQRIQAVYADILQRRGTHTRPTPEVASR